MRGVSDYFKKHAFKNTELKDLLKELENQSGRDLSQWSKLWLETAGVNTLRPEIVEKDGVIESFAILQSAERQSIFFPHLVRLLGCNNYKKQTRGRYRKEVFLLLAKTYICNSVSSEQGPPTVARVKHGYEHKVYTGALLPSRTRRTHRTTKPRKAIKKDDGERNVRPLWRQEIKGLPGQSMTCTSPCHLVTCRIPPCFARLDPLRHKN